MDHVVPFDVHGRRKIAIQLSLLYDDFTFVRSGKEGGKSILCYNDQELQFCDDVPLRVASDLGNV